MARMTEDDAGKKPRPRARKSRAGAKSGPALEAAPTSESSLSGGPQREKARRRRRGPRFWLTLILLTPLGLAFLGLALYFLTALVLAPAYGPRFLEDALSAALGGECHLDDVAMNPLSASLTLRGFSLDYPQGGRFLTFDELEVRPGRALLDFVPALSLLRVVNPKVYLTLHPDGRLSTQDFAPDGSEELGEAGKANGVEEPFPLAFVVENLQIEGGALDFEDHMHGGRHEVRDLTLLIPYTSSRREDAALAVAPALSATINGRAIRAVGQSVPFGPGLSASFDLDFSGLNLEEFKPYLASFLNFGLVEGEASARINLGLIMPARVREGDGRSKTNPPELRLSGDLELKDVILAGRAPVELGPNQEPELSLKRASFKLERLLSAANTELAVDNAVFEEPFVRLSRDKSGQLNWAACLAPPQREDAPGAPPELPGANLKAGAPENPPVKEGELPASASPATLAAKAFVKRLAVSKGSVLWQDDATGAPDQRLTNITVSLDEVALDSNNPGGKGTYAVFFEQQGGGALLAHGQWDLSAWSLAGKATLSALDLSEFKPYLQPILGLDLGRPKVLSLQGSFQLLPMPDKKNGLNLEISKTDAVISGVALTPSGDAGPWLNLPEAALNGFSLSLSANRIAADSLTLARPEFSLLRDANGDFALKSPADIANYKTPPAAAGEASPPEPAHSSNGLWRIEVAQARINGGRVDFQDYAGAGPGARTRSGAAAVFDLRDLNGVLRDVAVQAFYGGTTEKPLSFDLKASLGKDAANGKLALAGRLAPSPLDLDADVTAEQLVLNAFSAYLPPLSAVNIARGRLTGSVKVKAARQRDPDFNPALDISGSLTLGGLSMLDKGVEVMGLGAILLKDLRYSLGQGSLTVAEAELRRPRLTFIMQKDGIYNLSRLFGASPEPGTTGRPGAGHGPKAQPAKARAGKSAAPDYLSRIRVDSLLLDNGLVVFRDERPGFDLNARMESIKGKLTRLDTESNEGSPFTLEALLEDAPLSLEGSVNLLPVIFKDKSMLLNLNVDLQGLDLTPFSPYSVKYVAYPVEKGKLSVKSSINVLNGNLLTANTLRFSRLVLGHEDHSGLSADALRVPLKFGLSLLEDGKRDALVNFPIGGSLSDPEFSTSGVVSRVVGNLALRIFTSPFALIGSIFHPSTKYADLPPVLFAPGDDRLDAAGEKSCANAMAVLQGNTKSSLLLIGAAAPQESAAYLEAQVDKKLRRVKFRRMSRIERTAASEDQLILAAAEIRSLLEETYLSEGAGGTAAARIKDMSDGQLRAALRPQEYNARELALSRAKAVRGHLLAKDKELASRVEIEPVLIDQPEESARVKLRTRTE